MLANNKQCCDIDHLLLINSRRSVIEATRSAPSPWHSTVVVMIGELPLRYQKKATQQLFFLPHSALTFSSSFPLLFLSSYSLSEHYPFRNHIYNAPGQRQTHTPA